ncbi:hypothetical protein Bca52824_032648 [Brassica carinata]|uniref:phosphoethanolamine N-methyltransferase n=1 Tax=Brassica carinata TaxID=52824 RepID=A0A8X7SCW1_BRACI|nr:hypothetical protein Bca52824_032648 [Brassica carinata]
MRASMMNEATCGPPRLHPYPLPAGNSQSSISQIHSGRSYQENSDIDLRVEILAERMLGWVKPVAYIFFRESCFHQCGDSKRKSNPTHYREPRFYTKVFQECQARDASGKSFELTIEQGLEDPDVRLILQCLKENYAYVYSFQARMLSFLFSRNDTFRTLRQLRKFSKGTTFVSKRNHIFQARGTLLHSKEPIRRGTQQGRINSPYPTRSRTDREVNPYNTTFMLFNDDHQQNKQPPTPLIFTDDLDNTYVNKIPTSTKVFSPSATNCCPVPYLLLILHYNLSRKRKPEIGG